MRSPQPVHLPSRYDFTLELPTDDNGHYYTLHVMASSPQKRAPLWSWHESYPKSREDAESAAIEALHHVAMVCAMDRPSTRQQLDRGLRQVVEETTPWWPDQPELFPEL